MKACPHCQASYPTNYTHCPRDGTPLLESQAWREGTTIRSKYRILGKIGEGGMAVVYKAMHTRFEELRALKVMNPELSGDQAFVRRFTHEAVLTRKLQHANAVRVEDIDEAEDGRPFIVMEYIEGRSLKEVIQAEAPMASARVCSIAAQVAGALDAAHRLGIIHRDIKPANIFLVNAAGRETAKVLDFGIAKAKEGSAEDGMLSHSTLTGAGSVIGTPAYMSPEQARGLRGDQLDGRSDLYSLGVVMYEMLINGLPLKADTSVQWILAHAHTPPRPLWEARPDLQIPPALAALVMRCLAKNPHDRPESAYGLIEEIRQAEQQGGSPGRTLVFSSAAPENWASGAAPGRAGDVPATFVSASEPVPARGQFLSADVPSRSSRRWAAWGTASGLAVLIAAALVFWSLKRPAPAPAVAAGGASPSQSVISNDSPAETPAAGTAPAMPALPATPASQITHSPDTAGADAAPVPAPPFMETSRGNTDSAVSGDASQSAQQKKIRARNQAEILAKSRQFAQALLQAKNAENDGRFEDALREYEWASTLEPSDTALKRHIKQLRDRIARENELIH